MKIIIADKKTSFTDEQISLLETKGDVVFIETMKSGISQKKYFQKMKKY